MFFYIVKDKMHETGIKQAIIWIFPEPLASPLRLPISLHKVPDMYYHPFKPPFYCKIVSFEIFRKLKKKNETSDCKYKNIKKKNYCLQNLPLKCGFDYAFSIKIRIRNSGR